MENKCQHVSILSLRKQSELLDAYFTQLAPESYQREL